MISTLNDRIGRAVSWLTFVLVLLVVVDVTLRYLFNQTAVWIGEMEWHLFAFIFLLGAGYALRHDRHVRVDLFYDKFSPRDKALVNLVGHIVLLLPWTVLLIWVSTKYAFDSYQMGEGSPDPGGLPFRFVVKAAIPLGFFLLFLQGLAEIAKNWQVYRHEEVVDANG